MPTRDLPTSDSRGYHCEASSPEKRLACAIHPNPRRERDTRPSISGAHTRKTNEMCNRLRKMHRSRESPDRVSIGTGSLQTAGLEKIERRERAKGERAKGGRNSGKAREATGGVWHGQSESRHRNLLTQKLGGCSRRSKKKGSAESRRSMKWKGGRDVQSAK